MNIKSQIRESGNVLGSERTDNLITSVVVYVSQSVPETFGPYCHNVLI